MSEIIWKPIPSLNGLYEASSNGEIRNAKTKHILRQFPNRFGYMTLQVCPSPGIKKNARVHRLVAEAFYGECPVGFVVNHKDGNKSNNIPYNLEYVSSAQNNVHALETGLRTPVKMNIYSPHGGNHYRATITEDIARKILEFRKKFGYGGRKISKILGISKGVVDGVLYQNRWKCVKLKGEQI